MTADKTMLNFRCPNDLIEAIDQVGRQRYPADNKNGCDRSKTLMDIISVGIQALSDGSIEIPVSQTSRTDSKTDSKTDWEPQELKAALRSELMPEFNEMLAVVRREFEERLQTTLGELLA